MWKNIVQLQIPRFNLRIPNVIYIIGIYQNSCCIGDGQTTKFLVKCQALEDLVSILDVRCEKRSLSLNIEFQQVPKLSHYLDNKL